MKLVQAHLPTGADIVGAIDGDQVVELSPTADSTAPAMHVLLEMAAPQRQDLFDLASSEGRTHPLAEATLLAPIRSPGKVLAIARGYARQSEPTRGPDAIPYFFLKRSDDIIGPSEPITIGPPATSVVAEIELAVVVGQQARHLTAAEAMTSVGGYTIGNDVSARSLDVPPPGRRDENLDKFIDWINGKWLDGYLALGPAIVTSDEWHDDGDRGLTTRVSGQETVIGNTGRLLHSVAEIVAFASRLMTLNTGDVILTGMPETPKPERHLRPGDVVEGEIDGLGTLSNPIVSSESR